MLATVTLSSCGNTLQLKPTPGGVSLLPTATPGLPVQAPTLPASTNTEVVNPNPASPTAAPDPNVPTALVQPTESVVDPAPTAVLTPTINPELGGVALPQPAELAARWRAQQVERQVFPASRNYVSPSAQIVWWFDPLFSEYLPIGELRGEFGVQATFRIRGKWVEALEIPYNITNSQYGITVPTAIIQRMQNAGITEWAEVFVYKTQDISPKS